MTAEPSRWATRLYDAYVFDMDGTIYLGDHLLPGARRLIEELRERAKLNKSVIEILSQSGALKNLSETNQYTFF